MIGCSSSSCRQHAEVGLDHAVAILVRGAIVAAGRGVLRDLTEDPGIGGSGAADHDGVAASLGDHGDGVLGGEDVAVSDDGDAHGVLNRGDVLPARLAGVAVLAGAGVKRDGVQAAVLSEFRQRHADDVGVVPAHAELDREGDGDSGAHALEDDLDEREIAQQAGAAVAADDAFRGAAEVQVDEVEAGVLADAGAFGERFGIGAEESARRWDVRRRSR